MNWTKGKWYVSLDGRVLVKDGEQYKLICDMPFGSARESDEMPEDNANAHLIAAAPDMYEALSEVLGYAEEYGGMAFAGETGRTRDYFLQAIDKSQKALSKAEGK